MQVGQNFEGFLRVFSCLDHTEGIGIHCGKVATIVSRQRGHIEVGIQITQAAGIPQERASHRHAASVKRIAIQQSAGIVGAVGDGVINPETIK